MQKGQGAFGWWGNYKEKENNLCNSFFISLIVKHREVEQTFR